MIKTAITTKVDNMVAVQRALEEVKKELDFLRENLDTASSKNENEAEGRIGSLRIIDKENDESILEIKTKGGWKKLMVGETIVQLKKLKSNMKVPQKKSIDEIETDDDSTNDTVAKKTIFDEKADKFILPRPDYDSGWVQLDKNTTKTLTHNLELDTIPSLMKSYISTIATPVVGTNPIFECLQLNENNGFFIEIATSNTLKAHSGANGTFDPSTFGDLTNSDDIDDGYIRVLLWK